MQVHIRISCLCFLLLILSSCCGATAPSSRNYQASPTNTPRPQTALARTLQEYGLLDDPPTSSAYIEASGSLGAMLEVSYFSDAFWNDKQAVTLAAYSLRRLAPAVFDLDPELDILNVSYETTFVDAYGQESHHWYVRAQISRETCEKINWDNISRCSFPVVLDVWKVYAPLASTWEEVCNE